MELLRKVLRVVVASLGGLFLHVLSWPVSLCNDLPLGSEEPGSTDMS